MSPGGGLVGVGKLLDITMFGSTSAVVDGRRVSDLGGVKPRQILEILALADGLPVAKDRLAELLWDGEPPRSYVSTLESYVCVLRRSLGCSRGRSAAISTTASGYLLDPAQASVDLHECWRLLAQAATAAPRAACDLTEQALAPAASRLLASEAYAAWAERARESLAQELVVACTRAAHHALVGLDFERAVHFARRAVELDAFAEEAWQQLLRSLWAAGRRAEALRSYLDLRAGMVEELGVEPGPATRDLYLAILRDEPAGPEGQHLELTTLLGLLRQALESIPGVVPPQADSGLSAVAAALVGAC